MAIYTVREKYLSNNAVPIIVDELSPGIVINYQVLSTDETVIYEGVFYSFSSNYSFDIGFIFAFISEPGVKNYTIKFLQEDVPVQQFQFSIYAGAINSLLQRKLYALGRDIFEVKLHNVQTNFLLSTRSFSRYLFIPENELMPLFFYTKNKKFAIWAGDKVLANYDYSLDLTEQTANIDIDELRKNLFFTNGVLCNVFDIIPSGESIITTTIIVTKTNPAKYFIKFRNSFMAMEKISIDDAVDAEGEFEYMNIQQYDEVVSDYLSKSQEKKISVRYKGSISMKSNSERLWVIDMLLSKEIYFIANGCEYPAQVHATSPVLQSTRGLQNSIEIDITLAGKENAFSPDNIIPHTDIGVFNDTFNEVFY